MDDQQALAEVKRLAIARRVSFTKHAYDRMRERGAVVADVLAALSSATRAQHETGYKYRVTGGVDRDGDELSVIVAIEADLLVVTIF